MKQQTISDAEYSARKHKTKREALLEIMDEIIPWEAWVAYIEPYYPSGKRSHPLKSIEKRSRWRVEYKQYADKKWVAELPFHCRALATRCPSPVAGRYVHV